MSNRVGKLVGNRKLERTVIRSQYVRGAVKPQRFRDAAHILAEHQHFKRPAGLRRDLGRARDG